MRKLPNPIVYEIDYAETELRNLEKKVKQDKNFKIIFHYPTIYIVNNEQKTNQYSIYVGETTDIIRRTKEHLKIDVVSRDDWKAFSSSDNAKLLLIGHEHFNKSLTLDIENRLMHYMASVDVVERVENRRENQQGDYYTSDEMDSIFNKIWNKLHKKNNILFPIQSIIKDSALFKASPFHKLSDEQYIAKDKIIMKIEEALNRKGDGQLILVNGEAGSGKTVLMSSLFYEIGQLAKNEHAIFKGSTYSLLVNHDQQVIVYQQLAEKLGLLDKTHPDTVGKPTSFITNHSSENKVDVVIVDEAHLLWTQGKQAYRGKNQLTDLLERARVVVAVFDKHQILSREQYIEDEKITEMLHETNLNGNLIELAGQMRINANDETIHWIRNFINKKITNIPLDEQYDLQVFQTPSEMYEEIKKKAINQESGLSRVLATFDWPYINSKSNTEGKASTYWEVSVGDFSLPWNLQLPKDKQRNIKELAWAEQKQTLGEVGSTFTIQGFDLNYAGVIIGPSVKFRNGKVIFDKTASKNSKATQRRKLESGKMLDVSETLLQNELNVLLTRGVNGLYLFAVDEELQKQLLKAQAEQL